METLSRVEIEEQGLKINYTMPEGLSAVNPDFAGPARGGDWQIDLSRYSSPRLKQEILEGLVESYSPGMFPGVDFSQWLALQKRMISQEDLEAWETVLWAHQAGGVKGYPEWAARVLARGRELGEVYPVGNLPERVLAHLAQVGKSPRLSLVIIDDHAVLHMFEKVSAGEIGSISERLLGADWYWDQEDPALLTTWIREGSKWIKVVIRLNKTFGKGVANRVTTAGVVESHNIEMGGRYKKL